MTTGCATIVRADARALPLRDNSVDLAVTSPPFYALRSYQDCGEHYAGQVGSESTQTEYVDALIECTREWMRVLKPAGSIWVNLGDKYATTAPGKLGASGSKTAYARSGYRDTTGAAPTKSLIGLPWRYALRCIDELGLILRAEVIWAKPNGLPESVTDRVRRSHEQWFHFTKQPRYFSAVDEIREEHSPVSVARSGRNRFAVDRSQEGVGSPNTLNPEQACNPLGKLPGSVWEIPTQPLTVPAHLGVDHFAAFPLELPRRIILGWSPSGICTVCGEGRRPICDATPEWKAFRQQQGMGNWADPSKSSTQGNRDTYSHGLSGAQIAAFGPKKAITGYACACPEPTAPTSPSVVLDPFGGTGTTALAAKALGRHGVSVDMSADYCRIAAWRTNDPGELAKALGVAKPPAEVDGQTDLLDALGHW